MVMPYYILYVKQEVLKKHYCETLLMHKQVHD